MTNVQDRMRFGIKNEQVLFSALTFHYICIHKFNIMRRIIFTFILAVMLSTSLFAQTTIPSWGWVTVGCAHLRTESRHASEMASQAILGTPLHLLEQQGDWYRVETPEGYTGWMMGNSIVVADDSTAHAWRTSSRIIYTAHQGAIYATTSTRGEKVSDITIGSILQTRGKARKGFVPVVLPDGREGYIKRNECADFAEWAARPFDMEQVITTAQEMMGVTYLWGGTSVKGADCSGLTKIAYFAGGVILLRDASQQAKTGEQFVPDQWHDCLTGDLLFFGNAQGRVNHVGIYLHDGEYIHSSGRVKINSLNPQAPNYLPANLLSISRIKNRINTPGITAVAQHPWYFNQH